MTIYYSATTNAFYDTQVYNVNNIPEDKVAVAESTYKNLMAQQCAGRVIVAAADGTPTTIAQTCGSCTSTKYATKTELTNGLAAKANDSNVVHKTGDETIGGTKTFSSKIVGNLQGNADTATKSSCLDNYSNVGGNKIYLDWNGQVKSYVGLKVGNTALGGLITTNNIGSQSVSSATKATQDSAGQQINKTYIKELSVSGRTITYKRGDNTTGTITTQDTNTTYSKLSQFTNDTGFITSSGSCASATYATQATYSNQLQAFTGDDFTGGNHFVKAIRNSSDWSTRLWMCYNGGAKQSNEISVAYADSAGSAGSAGNGIDSSGSNYVKFKDGTQICWGSNKGGDIVTFANAFTFTPCISFGYNIGSDFDEIIHGQARYSSSTSFIMDVWNLTKNTWEDRKCEWTAIGRWK